MHIRTVIYGISWTLQGAVANPLVHVAARITNNPILRKIEEYTPVSNSIGRALLKGKAPIIETVKKVHEEMEFDLEKYSMEMAELIVPHLVGK